MLMVFFAQIVDTLSAKGILEKLMIIVNLFGFMYVGYAMQRYLLMLM